MYIKLCIKCLPWLSGFGVLWRTTCQQCDFSPIHILLDLYRWWYTAENGYKEIVYIEIRLIEKCLNEFILLYETTETIHVINNFTCLHSILAHQCYLSMCLHVNGLYRWSTFRCLITHQIIYHVSPCLSSSVYTVKDTISRKSCLH